MTVTPENIAELRRKINEPDETTYDDTLLETIIEKYPMIDERGIEPYYWTISGVGVPEKTANTAWIATYDLNAAAAEVWQDKAALYAGRFDFKADGGDFAQSQEFVHAKSMAAFFGGRISSRTIKQVVAISEQHDYDTSWIGNLPEQD